MHRVTTAAALIGLLLTGPSLAADPPPLALEAKIPLAAVSGRIDHFAFDPERRLLFVAELGNDSLDVIDVEKRTAIHRISGLSEPQGVAYHLPTRTLYVANGGDGSLRLFQGPNYTANGRIDFGSDADNVRVNQSNQRVVVG